MRTIDDLLYNKREMKMETDMERLERYEKEEFPIEAKTDKCWWIRLRYFEEHGFTIEALKDEYPVIVQLAKKHLEEIKMDILERYRRDVITRYNRFVIGLSKLKVRNQPDLKEPYSHIRSAEAQVLFNEVFYPLIEDEDQREENKNKKKTKSNTVLPFSLKLGEKEYEGKRTSPSLDIYLVLLMLEIFGEKTYEFMKRNKVRVEDDNGLWKFIQTHFEKSR